MVLMVMSKEVKGSLIKWHLKKLDNNYQENFQLAFRDTLHG